MPDDSPQAICKRIAQLRLETDGPRGKSAFARRLGLSPSTYDYYEADRVPPADVLVRIARTTGVDLQWLLTGQATETACQADHPALQRAARLLSDAPNAGRALAAFVDLLAAADNFPPKPAAAEAAPEAQDAEAPARPAADAGWIPILGRTAAGVPAFWRDDEDTRGIATLEQIVARHAGREPQRISEAHLETPPPGELSVRDVQIVTLTEPDEASGLCRFLICPQCRSRYPDAFALQVDGESMAPEIGHGQLVLLSPSAPAIEAQPAVVQLRGQIGVTCKLYRTRGDEIQLIPINEAFAPTRHGRDQVEWALRVLARIKT
jgi:SOS-response transcriptional repressor LexA